APKELAGSSARKESVAATSAGTALKIVNEAKYVGKSATRSRVPDEGSRVDPSNRFAQRRTVRLSIKSQTPTRSTDNVLADSSQTCRKTRSRDASCGSCERAALTASMAMAFPLLRIACLTHGLAPASTDRGDNCCQGIPALVSGSES